MRRILNSPARLLLVAALAATALGGCGTSIKYAYAPAASFSGAKTYQWSQTATSGRDALIDENVRFIADRALESKGWTRADAPELLFSTAFDYEIGNVDRYMLQQVTVRAVRRDNGEPVWRGTALGSIDTSATSSDLKNAVDGIFSKFPPR